MRNIRKEANSFLSNLAFVDSYHALIFPPKTFFQEEEPAGEKMKRQHLVVYFSILLHFFPPSSLFSFSGKLRLIWRHQKNLVGKIN